MANIEAQDRFIRDHEGNPLETNFSDIETFLAGRANQPGGLIASDANGWLATSLFPELGSLHADREGIPDDGTDAGPAFKAACEKAISLGVPLELKSGATYTFLSSQGTIGVPFGSTLSLFARGAGALLYNNTAVAARAFQLAPGTALATGLSLTANVTAGETRTSIDASALLPGAILTFSSNDIVDDLHNYAKRWNGIIGSVAPDFTYAELTESHDFSWTTAETTCAAYLGGAVRIDNIGFRAGGSSDRDFSLIRLSDFDINFMRQPVRGSAKGGTNRPLFIGQTNGGFLRNALFTLGEYNTFITLGAANLKIIDPWCVDTRHGIDCNTWARDIIIEGLRGRNCVNNFQCHGSIRVQYRDGIDEVDGTDIGSNMRCVGGGLWRCKLVSPNALSSNGVHGPRLKPAYQYLADNAIRTYEDYDAPLDYIGCEDSRRVEVRRSTVKNLTINGAGDNVSEVMVDSVSRITDALALSDVRVLPSEDSPLITAVSEDVSGTLTVDVTKVAGIGWYPKLAFTTILLEGETDVVGAANLDIPCHVAGNFDATGGTATNRTAVVRVEARGIAADAALLARSKIFMLAFDRNGGTIAVSAAADAAPAVGDMDISLESVSVSSAGPVFTIRATVTDNNDIVRSVRYYYEETRS